MTDFDILGIEPGADASAVDKAFKKIIKKYHPDLNSDKVAAGEMTAMAIEARDRIRSGKPNMGQSQPQTQAASGATDEFWKAYRARKQEQSYERYQYKTWDEQGADEDRRRAQEEREDAAAERQAMREQRRQAQAAVDPDLQKERNLKAAAARSTKEVDTDLIKESTEQSFASGSLNRETALRSYATYRAHVLREELNTSPPRANRYERSHVEALPEQVTTELFERDARLRASLTARPRGGVATMVVRDFALLRDGLITSEDAQFKLTLAAMQAEKALLAEQSLIRAQAAKLDKLSPEEKVDYAKRRIFNLANGAATELRESDGKAGQRLSLLAADAAKPVDSASAESVGTMAHNASRLSDMLSVERLSTNDDFKAWDSKYLQSAVLAKVSQQAARETELIYGEEMFPLRDAERLSTLRVAATSHAALRVDAAHQSEESEGLLGKMSRRLGQKESWAEAAANCNDAPLSDASLRLNEAVLSDPKVEGLLRRSAERFQKSSGEYTKLHSQIVSSGAEGMKNVVASEPNGEYLVSRAIGARLSAVCDRLEEAAGTYPPAMSQINALRKKLSTDERVQVSGRKLRDVASGLGELLPQKGNLADLRVTLDTAHKGAEMLTEVEQRRWAEEHFAGDQIKKTAHGRIEAAYEKAQKDPNITRESSAFELKDALSKSIKTGLERNPAPKNKALFAEASRQFEEKFRDGGHSDEATGFSEAILKSGLITDEKDANILATAIGRVSVSLDREQAAVDAHLDKMRAQEATGKSADDIIAAQNKALAEAMGKSETCRPTFAALRESMETNSGLEARQRESAAIQRNAASAPGDAFAQAKATAAYADEKIAQSRAQSAYQQKKRQNDDDAGNIDISA